MKLRCNRIIWIFILTLMIGSAYPVTGSEVGSPDIIGVDCPDNIGPGADLRNCDLSEANLESVDLNGANLRGANLVGANLRNANLAYTGMANADLSNAQLSSADLTGSYMESADLSGADLTGAVLNNVNLTYAKVIGANLKPAHFGSKVDLTGVDLSGFDLSDKDLRGVNFESANLSKVNLKNANLKSANLTQANRMNANLSGANLMSASLGQANLMNADLSGANLKGANLSRGKNLKSADLSGANLEEAWFDGSDLDNYSWWQPDDIQKPYKNPFSASAVEVQANFQSGLEAYRAGDYETAFQELVVEAEKGNAEAQYYIGHMHWMGYGVEQNDKEAVKWFKEAARRGNKLAKTFLRTQKHNERLKSLYDDQGRLKDFNPRGKITPDFYFIFIACLLYFASFIRFYIKAWEWMGGWKNRELKSDSPSLRVTAPDLKRNVILIQILFVIPFLESCLYVADMFIISLDAAKNGLHYEWGQGFGMLMTLLLLPRLFFVVGSMGSIWKGTRQKVEDEGFFKKAKIQVLIILVFSALPIITTLLFFPLY